MSNHKPLTLPSLESLSPEMSVDSCPITHIINSTASEKTNETEKSRGLTPQVTMESVVAEGARLTGSPTATSSVASDSANYAPRDEASRSGCWRSKAKLASKLRNRCDDRGKLSPYANALPLFSSSATLNSPSTMDDKMTAISSDCPLPEGKKGLFSNPFRALSKFYHCKQSRCQQTSTTTASTTTINQVTMRAAQITQHGGADVIRYVEMPVPKVHPSCLLVRNEFVGVNQLDINQRTGRFPSKLPCIVGREGAGTVVAVGSNVAQQFSVGDRVAYVGNYASAEYACVCPRATYKLPGGVSFETGATFILQGIMALALVTEAYRVKVGDWVLVYAAAGGVGSLLVQLCKHYGAKVIGVTSTATKAQHVKSLGADYVMLYNQPGLADEVKRLTYGRGVDVVYDSVGKDTFSTSLKCTRRCGNLVAFGCTSGQVPPINIVCLSVDNVKLSKPTLFNYIVDRSEFELYAYQLFDMVQRGQLKPVVYKIYPLSAIREAHQDLESRVTVGKLLLRP
ncbi:hypothetical protein IWQ62_000030 [Dispira parvispora]|uniref:Probable quinone oxidoreductase n=1 Tax=Dispira parvispora TaxID=1520584 RepID=A0A9W8AZ92_9FUNG|nr:hypothetical protein IWQ62_000030 [Dispira parvispora]